MSPDTMRLLSDDLPEPAAPEMASTVHTMAVTIC